MLHTPGWAGVEKRAIRLPAGGRRAISGAGVAACGGVRIWMREVRTSIEHGEAHGSSGVGPVGGLERPRSACTPA